MIQRHKKKVTAVFITAAVTLAASVWGIPPVVANLITTAVETAIPTTWADSFKLSEVRTLVDGFSPSRSSFDDRQRCSVNYCDPHTQTLVCECTRKGILVA